MTTFRNRITDLLKTASVVLLLANTVWFSGAGEVDDELYWAEMQPQKMSQQLYKDIWQQKLPPHQAVQKLMLAGEFSTIPGAFAPYLHNLYYRLGILTHSRNSSWTPEITRLCTALQRFNALFAMLSTVNTASSGGIVLLGMPRPGLLPECDLLPVTGTPSPVTWQAVSGKKFQTAVIALPCRPWRNVAITLTPIGNEKQTHQLTAELQKVEYFYEQRQWQYRLRAVTTLPLTSQMQIFLLTVIIPPELPPGSFSGKIIMQVSDLTLPAIFEYQLNIQPQGGKNAL